MEKKKKKEVKPPIIEVQKQKIFSTKEIFFFIYALNINKNILVYIYIYISYGGIFKFTRDIKYS